MIQFLQRLLIFVSISFLLGSGYSVWIRDSIHPLGAGKYVWVCDTKDQDFDFVFSGSSRTEMTIDPRVIDDELGTNSANIGASGAGAGDQYLLTEFAIDQNDVDLVLYQVDYLSLADKFSYPFRDYCWLCYDDSPTVREALIDHRGRIRYGLWKAVPFLHLMEFSSQYKFGASSNPDSFFGPTKGGQQRDTPFDPNHRDVFSVYKPQPLPLMYTRKALDMCEQRQQPIILFQAPLRNTIDNVSSFPECTERIHQLAKEYGLEYWDFSKLYWDSPEYFYDHHHLNSSGVEAFSQELATRIDEWGPDKKTQSQMPQL